MSHFHASRRTLGIASLAASLLLPATSAAYSPDYYALSSKLAKDKWIKVKIKDSGVYEISYDQLRKWGFSNPEAVNVYGMGGTLLSANKFESSLPDDIQLSYTIHDGSKLYFYGSGDIVATPTSSGNVITRRNVYSTDTYYLLSDREVSDAEKTTPITYQPNVSTAPLTSHVSVLYAEDELQNPCRGGSVYLGHNITADAPLDIVFDVRDMDSGNTTWKTATAHFAFAANAQQQTKLNVTLPSAIDASTVTATLSASANNPYTEVKYRVGSSRYVFDANLADGAYTFRATYADNSPDFLAMDYAWLSYPRTNRLGDDSQLVMTFPGAKRSTNFAVQAPRNARLLNASIPARIAEFETAYDDATGMLTATFDANYTSTDHSACRVAVFDPSLPQKNVEYVGTVPNTNFHAMATPTMLIITTRELVNEANELAQAHRDIDGMDVEVAIHDEIFNEFSGSTPDAMAYRRLVKMLYDRNPDKLKYLLLYGPTHWDNRGLIEPLDGMMLSYETSNPNNVANTTKNFCSDVYFTILGENSNPALLSSVHATIAVGRIPATSQALARQANRKIIKYMRSMPSEASYNNVIFLSDDGDNNSHILQAEQLIKYMTVNEAITATRAHNLIYQWEANDAKDLRNVATAALRRGAGFFAYVGHATPEAFAAENVWSKAAVNTTEYSVPPFALLSTCDAFGVDRADGGITESMMFKENGGMIGIVGASRTVFGHYNQYLAINMTKAYSEAKAGTTVGQLWQTAFNEVFANANSNDLRSNTLCYNLCGDPAVRIPAPSLNAEITTINGIQAPADESYTINPLETYTLEGRIVDAEGNTAGDFNGTVKLILFDAPYTVKTMPRDSKDLKNDILDITLNHDILTTKTVKVENGVFTAVLAAPVPVHEGSANRLTLHADGDNGQRAQGYYNNLLLTTLAEAGGDIAGNEPVIEALAVNNFDTPDGAIVDGNVSIVAKGSVDVIGLNSSTAIGSGCSLIIDGIRHIDGAKEAITVDTENNWTISTEIDNLDDGSHYATLTIADNAGRRVSRTVSFTVINAAPGVELTADVETANDAIVFDLTHPFDNAPDCRLVIEDRLGNTILSQQGVTFPYTWQFASNAANEARSTVADCKSATTNSAGNTPADGYYSAYVIVNSSGRYGASPRLPFVIVK